MGYFRTSLYIASSAGLMLEMSENYRNMIFAFSSQFELDSANLYLNQYLDLKQKLKIDHEFLAALEKSNAGQESATKLTKRKIESITKQLTHSKNSHTITFIISLVIISGLIIFIYLLFAMLISRRKQRKKFYRKTNR